MVPLCARTFALSQVEGLMALSEAEGLVFDIMPSRLDFEFSFSVYSAALETLSHVEGKGREIVICDHLSKSASKDSTGASLSSQC